MNESKIEVLKQPENLPDSFIIKLLRNKSLLINIAFAIIFFGITIGIVQSKISRRQQKSASIAYTSLNQQDQLEPHADLQRLSKIANKYPFLRAHLDAPLVQECLNRGEIKLAKSLHNRVESRLLPHLDFLFKSNQISFLISEKKYQEALKLSYDLKDKINSKELPTLYSYHMLRIASLEKELGNLKQYNQQINEFVSLTPTLNLERDALRIGEISLIDYVTLRKEL